MKVLNKTSLARTLLLLGLFSMQCVAEQESVRYKAFYSHVKKLSSEDTNALQFAFGFKHINTGDLCQINEVFISTQKQTIPLTVSAENRFTVPKEKALNLADAQVVIDLVEPANQCDMSVQLETKPEYLKTEYSVQDLQFIYAQYEAFFNEMGSFLSFMMPQVTGLTMQFTDPSYSVNLASGDRIQQGLLTLNKQWFSQIKPLELPQKPLRITAIASK